MPINSKTLITLAVGAVIGAGSYSLFAPSHSNNSESTADSGEKKPLYWVAPMDSNYRRDKPGKSPMGMDLVPVYEEDSSGDEHGPGAVTIAPHVVNNLGVKSTKVEIGTLAKHIATVGYVQYDEDKLVHIHPRVSGWIEKLFVKAEGDPVEKGQALYTLYSPELVNAQEEFLIAVKRNNQVLVTAAKERLQTLQLSENFINQLQKTKQVKQSITFYAPQSGVLDGLKIREGFYVQPGNTLMSIGQLAQVWVEAEVFERDAAFVSQGLPVDMTLDYLPGKSWQGEVDYVYPSLNAQNRTLRVRLRFDNPNLELKPNMYAQISIQAESNTASVLVPKEAVIRTGKQDRVVLVLGEGQYKSIAVTLGAVEAGKVEILEGLTEGDKVVTSAQFLIDSESSKNSDFKRMTHEEEPESVWMEGEINSVMAGHRMANITHGPADAWGWPEMTMDFMVGDSVDIDALKTGQTLHFEVSKTDDDGYEVTGIHIMSEPSDNHTQTESNISSATVNGVINSIDSSTRIINISREAIEKWSRPAATLDFVANETIDLSTLSIGQEINFTFEIHDDFIIVEINDAEDHTMNHDGHEMDHSQHNTSSDKQNDANKHHNH
ncbi:efflux RND transporter periplasmic adaptor subunit [Thalassomonas sp. M1454]|uniref:efflux RND transporter periplasmic adaptor subunit n=1 Tax=Thalassomonas sp. M1454 TaxID=2594477 RepID=UPI00117EB7DB|nr:efflux RND transporter periplasmic adaptor subunit [Thalassomonas sp. M1454]TRX55152.1 efflux RND transporter periplasmic adaptor subunit [Thalassomonas sp. M1454]